MIKKFANFYSMRSLFKDTITTTIWSTIGKAGGFMIPFFIATWFGTNKETDAFFFTYGLILFLAGIFAPVVENVIVPYLMEFKINDENNDLFVSNILILFSAFLFIILILLIFFAKPLLRVVTDFNAASVNIAYRVLLEISPLIFLLLWTSILTGILNTQKRFFLPAISPGFRAVVNLFVIYVFKNDYGIHAIPLGYVVGEMFRFIILFYIINKLNLFRFRPSFSIDHRVILFSKSAFFQIASMITIGINPFVDKTMASWLGEGSITILYYADRLYIIPVTFIVSGLLVTLLSHWSDLYYHEGTHSFVKMIKKSSITVFFITLPMMILFILFRYPILNLIFGRGSFSQNDISEVGLVWVCYLTGFLPYVMGLLLVHAHLVFKKTKALFYLSGINCFLNIVLNFLLMKKYNIAGIALSTSIASVFTTIGLYISLLRIIKNSTKNEEFMVF